jgi:GT2 family glycosyltransferase
MQMRGEQDTTSQSIEIGENGDNSSVSAKRLLIAIPSYTGTTDCLAAEGFMRLIGNIAGIKQKFEVYTSIVKRTPIVLARNRIAKTAIDQKCDYIFWVDDDMVLKPDINIIEKLIAHDKDIIAPLFFSRAWPYIPMIFKRRLIGPRFCVYDNIMDYQRGLLKVDGIGFGCVLTKVSIFDKLSKPYFWNNDIFGEDLYFCEKASQAGLEIYCDTTIEVGHICEPQVAWEIMHIQNKEANYTYIQNKAINDTKLSEEYYAAWHKNIGKKIDIVMPCYHNLETTKNAVESVLANTEDVNYNIIAIIDGYDKELEDYFSSKKQITTILNQESKGFIKATNQGLEKVRDDCDFVLLLNNDIVIYDPKWLIKMVNSFDDKTGAVGPFSNFVMGLQNQIYNTFPLEHYTKFLIGFCMLIRKDVLDKVGNLDERFGIGGQDDLDISLRIRESGYKLKVNRDTFVYHIGFQSLSKVFPSYKEIEDITRPQLIEKWGEQKVSDLFNYTENFILTGEEDDKVQVLSPS